MRRQRAPVIALQHDSDPLKISIRHFQGVLGHG